MKADQQITEKLNQSLMSLVELDPEKQLDEEVILMSFAGIYHSIYLQEIVKELEEENQKVQSMHTRFSKDFLKGYASAVDDLRISVNDLLKKRI